MFFLTNSTNYIVGEDRNVIFKQISKQLFYCHTNVALLFKELLEKHTSKAYTCFIYPI